MRVALVYDRLNKQGGAEAVLEHFHALYPKADWYTSVWDSTRAPFSKTWRVSASWLSKFPFLRTHHEWLPWLMPFVFEAYDFAPYDLVISIGSAECKGIITRPGTYHLHYCLTPTRYLYSHQAEYLRHKLYQVVARPLRAWDQVAATRPDSMIAISHHVKSRIKKYYNRPSSVIYPPVATARFAHAAATSQGRRSDYYLTVARLVPYKRLDLLVRAFNELGRPLIIAGTGSEARRLARLAHPNIKLVGFVDDQQLLAYYHRCRAFIQVNEEDFGLAMVEAQAAGKPVISLGRGGATEIVKNGETGILFESQSVAAIRRAVDTFETMDFQASACQANARRFDARIWRQKMLQTIHNLCPSLKTT